MNRRCTVLTGIVAIFFVALATTACTSDKDSSVPGDANPDSTQSAAGAPAPATTVNRCPMTAEQVSAAVGAQVKGPDSTCSFFPADEDNVRPNAAYVQQVSFACSGKTPAENDYSETLEGLEQPAYIADRFDGTWILVCRSGAPFEIRVDVSGNDVARAAATALARQVLAAR